ncbi:peroxiredoxin-like 2A, partial [Astyanax mexicanus]
VLFWDSDGVFGLSVWSLAVCVVIVCVLLVNTDLFLAKPQQTALDTLANADLQTTSGVEDRQFKALELWKETGAIIMAEASELSSLRPQLDILGVPLYAVVKENVGMEIQNFRPYFNGEIFVDEKKCFYGCKTRKMGYLGLLRFGVIKNILQAWLQGYMGNKKGEGFILGGLYVIGPGCQGILMEHHEKEFGDKADLRSVTEAVRKVEKSDPDLA